MPRSGSTRNRRKQVYRGHARRSGASGRSSAPVFSDPSHVISLDRFEVPTKPAFTMSGDEAVLYTESKFMPTLLKEIEDLKTAVRGIAGHLGVRQEAISLRDISDDTARAEILAAFQRAGDRPLYYDDISEQLRIPIDQVARLCDVLISEGVLGAKIADE